MHGWNISASSPTRSVTNDGSVEKAVRATTACLIMADYNHYSVDARASGRMVLVRSHAKCIVVLLDGEVGAGRPPTSVWRYQIIHEPWRLRRSRLAMSG